MTLYDLISENYAKVKDNDVVMWATTKRVSDMLCPMKESKPDEYWAFMKKIYSDMVGAHYNEHFSTWEVAQMQHKGTDGILRKGAHWTLEQVQEVFAKIKGQIKPTDNIYDVFVALNSFYHDNCNLYQKWFVGQEKDAIESKIIEGAINYFFKDEDAPDGKIWLYYCGMRYK